MSDQPLPIKPHLKIPDSGDPYIEGLKCKSCGAISLRERMACPKCGARESLEPHRLSNQGKLHAFSITHRAFPGIEVPFISAIADLDGGGTIKTNMIDIEPDPEKIELGMDIEVTYKIAPRKDGEGNEYMTYYIRPKA